MIDVWNKILATIHGIVMNKTDHNQSIEQALLFRALHEEWSDREIRKIFQNRLWTKQGDLVIEVVGFDYEYVQEQWSDIIQKCIHLNKS